MGRSHFLVRGTEKGFTAASLHFSYFKYVVIIFLTVIHLTYHFFTEIYVKIMLKISTSQLNLYCIPCQIVYVLVQLL